MSSTNLAYINGDMVVWARAQNGITYAQIEKSLTVSKKQIVAWETGDALPTFNQAIALANVLQIPFGYLFLSKPPDVTTPLPDLRTRKKSERRAPSSNFLELLYEVLSKQEWYRDLLLWEGGAELPFVSKFTLRDSVATVAADMRRTLAITANLRREARTLTNYLSLLSANAEAAGVIVLRSSLVANNTRRKLSAEEFQGFAIADKIAPFVFVNTDDFKAAQIFTLAHELAHIWVGKSGISNSDEVEVEPVREEKVEVFCNRVAVETLVPADEFLQTWRGGAPESAIARLANEFKVSTFVILRRAHELNAITTPEFYQLLNSARGKVKTDKDSGGGEYWRNVQARHSQKFMDAVLGDARKGGTVWRDAARLLGVPVSTLIGFAERPG